VIIVSQRIRVNAVSPGMIDTPMADVVTGGHREMLVEMVKSVPMGKLGVAEDIADAVCGFAVTDQNT